MEEKKRNPKDAAKVLRNLEAIRKRCAAMPVIDNRSADEILGYGKNGLPGEIWEEGYEP